MADTKGVETADYVAVCERVERARNRKAKSLSLSDYGALDRLPELNGLLTLNEFMVFGSGIKSVPQIAALKNVRRLFIARGQLVDLTGLEELTSLTQLYLWGNPKLSDLSPLRGLTRLKALVLSSTAVADLEPIQNLKNLTDLRLESTSVADLSPLRNLRNLQRLNLSGAPLDDVSVLSELTSLYSISLDGTRVDSLDAIGKRDYLHTLNISRTRVSSLNPISHLKTLSHLGFAETNVTDLSPLKDMYYLRSLDLQGTKVADLSPLADLPRLENLFIENSAVRDLSPVSDYERMFNAIKSYGGLRFAGCPIVDPTILSFAPLEDGERTKKTINYVRSQQNLPPFEENRDQKNVRDPLTPVENVNSPLSFQFSPSGTIVLQNSPSSWPILPYRSSERDFENRLNASRTLAQDLVSELVSGGAFQARPDYLEALRRYTERLPRSKNDGSILLADAEARTIRNLFASEVGIISTPFASRLKTFLEQHLGLRVYYPELTSFYRDVQTGRIDDPLPLDAVDGFVQVVRENTPAVFDISVEEAIDGAAEPTVVIAVASNDVPADANHPMPPNDPLGEVNTEKAHDYTFAGSANGLWKVFLEGERVNRSIEAWGKAGAALRPYVGDILDWLHRFTSSGGQ